MIYEVRGSMMVFFALGTTSAFTPNARCATLIILTGYSLFYGDFYGEVPFYTGTLLADMALCLKSSNLPQSLSSQTIRPYSLISIAKSYWAIALAIFALFLGSYPPGNPDIAAWSRFLFRVGYSLNPAAGILLLHFRLTN